ncbi:hypothetical protein [Mesorhizobium sp.]|uniref:hypothetical protein n=1 Tax=Mesorhizobium sp. TaxID=1871066 RepID=UPI000FE950B6|nr:hypothetical protein [Mesorhizobium sp.]RWO89818.1 MAG: hypothetical protein EOQ95_16855 [Mesorhizobium sp.]
MLFNFDFPPNGFYGYHNDCGHDYRGPSFWGCTIALPHDVELIAADGIDKLRTIMSPWHSLVCHRPKLSLPDSVMKNIQDLARPRIGGEGARKTSIEVATSARELPGYVGRLIERAASVEETRRFLDFDYWDDEPGSGRNIAGVVVIDDRS